MDKNIDELEKEYNVLEQTLQMYNNTLNEMLAKNAKSSAINAIENEISSTKEKMEKIVSVAKRLYEVNTANGEEYDSHKYKCDKMAEQFLEDMKDKEEVDMEIPSNCNPVKVNHFLVRFPEKYNIHTYMVDSFYMNGDKTITIMLREFEGTYPILPLEIDDMCDDNFEISLDVLNSDKSLYYTILFEDCTLNKEYGVIPPFCEYKNSSVRLWSITIAYRKKTYLTAIPSNTK